MNTVANSNVLLTCRDLRAGDILLKVAGSAFKPRNITGNVIRFGQALVGSMNPDVVHAGIMFDSTYIIEAQAGGITAHDLRVQNRAYGYYVYRCSDPAIAQGAGTCAKMMFDIHKTHGSMSYNLGGAVASLIGAGGGAAVQPVDMDVLLGRVLAGRQHAFFCSQFVVYVYQFVAAQNGCPPESLFSLSDAKATPSALAAHLVSRPMFRQVGVMFPNQR